MSLWDKMKGMAKNHLAERKRVNQEIEDMSDNQLKIKAVRLGGIYADAWVKRKTTIKELNRRVNG